MDRLLLVACWACIIIFQLHYTYETQREQTELYHIRILAHQKEATSEKSLVVQTFNTYFYYLYKATFIALNFTHVSTYGQTYIGTVHR